MMASLSRFALSRALALVTLKPLQNVITTTCATAVPPPTGDGISTSRGTCSVQDHGPLLHTAATQQRGVFDFLDHDNEKSMGARLRPRHRLLLHILAFKALANPRPPSSPVAVHFRDPGPG